jgi:hypothetical protein
VYDIPEDLYHSDPVPGGSLSCSGAKQLLPPSCPAKFRHNREHPPAPSEAMERGTAVHKLVLGVGADIAVLDYKDWRTAAAREARVAARAAGKVPLLAADYAGAQAVAAAVLAHPLGRYLFNPGHGAPERSLFWQDEETGVWLRSRLDFLPERRRPGRKFIIPDLKTAKSADVGRIEKAVADYSYFMQAAFYADGVRALGIDHCPDFVFVFVEPEPPYLVTVAQLDDAAMNAGRRENRRAIERYRDCTESGIWPGYSDTPTDIERISLPYWKQRRLEEAA